MTYYEILGVPSNCSSEGIEAAYKRLAKVLHPDINPNGAQLMRAVNEAYETLGDESKRRQYDKSGKGGPYPLHPTDCMCGGTLCGRVTPRPPVAETVNADGSFNFVALMQHVTPDKLRDSFTPLVGALLEHVGVDPKAATVAQMLNAAGIIKPAKKARARHAG